MNHLLNISRKSLQSAPRTISNIQSASRILSRHAAGYVKADKEKILQSPDDNDRALEELDLSLLKPFPEFRKVAAGPLMPSNLYKLTWEPWKLANTPQKLVEPYDKEWDEYCDKHGHTPAEYFSSPDFEKRYGGMDYIWLDYYRPHKGRVQKQRTRRSCIKQGVIKTASPCPICRDPKILISYKNVPLLKNFIDPHTLDIISNLRTGNCRMRQGQLERAIELARSLGYLETKVMQKPVGDYYEKFHTFAV